MFRHRHRRPAILLVVLVCLLLLAACGSAAAPGVEEPAEEAPAEAPAVEEPVAEEPIPEEPGPEEPNPEEPAPAPPADAAGSPPVLNFEANQLPQPELCDPANPQLIPLREYGINETDSQILDGQLAYFVDYVNEKGQTFRITADSANPEAALKYLEEVAVCFEALETGPPEPIEGGSIPYSDVLLAAAAEGLGLSFSEFIQVAQTAVAGGEATTLAELLQARGGDPEEVLFRAMEMARGEIDAMLNGGLLNGDEATDLVNRLEFVLRGMLTEDSLLDLTQRGAGVEDFPRELQSKPEDLVVTTEWLYMAEGIEGEQIENYGIVFVIDPTIVSGQSIWYSWLNRRYVSAYLRVTRGRVGLYLYRWDGAMPYTYLGYAAATATAYTGTLSRNTSSCFWYRVRTYGIQSNNYYTMYGTWRYASPDSCG